MGMRGRDDQPDSHKFRSDRWAGRLLLARETGFVAPSLIDRDTNTPPCGARSFRAQLQIPL